MYSTVSTTKPPIQPFLRDLPQIRTPRLILRPMLVGDARDMYDYARRGDVTRSLLWNSHGSIDQTRRYLRYVRRARKHGELTDWAIICGGRMIGTCGFADLRDIRSGDPLPPLTDRPEGDIFRYAEAGYVVSPQYRGQGIAPEALGALMKAAFEHLAVDMIAARFMQGNDASLRVMQKCSMRYIGTEPDAIIKNGVPRPIHRCHITAQEYWHRTAPRLGGDAVLEPFRMSLWRSLLEAVR